jgi:hypothetical protein
VSPNVASARWRLAVRLTVAALVWSIGLIVAALLVPAYSGQTVTDSRGVTLTTATLVQVHGARALIITAIPGVVSIVVGFALCRRRATGPRWTGIVAWSMIAVLAIVALLGILSVGVFMLPVVVLLAISTRLVPGPDTQVARRRTAPARAA